MGNRRNTLLVGAVIVVSATLGCGGSSSNSGGSATASLRIVLMNPSTGTVNVMVGGNTVANGLPYLGNTGYFSVKAGSETVAIPNQTAPIDGAMLNLASGSQSTFFDDGWGHFEASWTILTDDNTPSPTSAKLRIMNGAVEGAGDFYLLPAGSTPSGAPLAPILAFNHATSYQVLAPGAYEVFVTLSQTPTQILFDSGLITLAAGQNRTMVVLSNCQPTSCGFNDFISITLADMN